QRARDDDAEHHGRGGADPEQRAAPAVGQVLRRLRGDGGGHATSSAVARPRERQDAPTRLIRGSTCACTRSPIALPTNTNTVVDGAVPSSRGTSCPRAAAVVAAPRPG